MTNWMAPQNPWNLEAPPDWVLRKMREYDDQLVILPGLREPVYRLMRRSAASKRLSAPSGDSEIGQAIKLGLVPVTSILNKPNWHELFLWLREHDLWAVGGADKAEALIAEHEAKAKIDTARQEQDDLEQIGSSAWFAKQLRAGEATFVRKGNGATS